MILDRLGWSCAVSLAVGACNPIANGLGSDSGMLGRPTPMDLPPTTGLSATSGPPSPPVGTGGASASSGVADDTGATSMTDGGTTMGGDPLPSTGDADPSTGEPEPPPQSLPEHGCEDEDSLMSTLDVTPAGVWFINKSGAVRRLYWLDYTGDRVFLDELDPGDYSGWFTFVTHPFLVTDAMDQCITIFVMVEGEHEIFLY